MEIVSNPFIDYVNRINWSIDVENNSQKLIAFKNDLK